MHQQYIAEEDVVDDAEEDAGPGRSRLLDNGAGLVVIRPLASGGFEVDHDRRGGGFTRVTIASEADAHAYADGVSEAGQ